MSSESTLGAFTQPSVSALAAVQVVNYNICMLKFPNHSGLYYLYNTVAALVVVAFDICITISIEVSSSVLCYVSVLNEKSFHRSNTSGGTKILRD